jgi:hypothetical protein
MSLQYSLRCLSSALSFGDLRNRLSISIAIAMALRKRSPLAATSPCRARSNRNRLPVHLSFTVLHGRLTGCATAACPRGSQATTVSGMRKVAQDDRAGRAVRKAENLLFVLRPAAARFAPAPAPITWIELLPSRVAQLGRRYRASARFPKKIGVQTVGIEQEKCGLRPATQRRKDCALLTREIQDTTVTTSAFGPAGRLGRRRGPGARERPVSFSRKRTFDPVGSAFTDPVERITRPTSVPAGFAREEFFGLLVRCSRAHQRWSRRASTGSSERAGSASS